MSAHDLNPPAKLRTVCHVCRQVTYAPDPLGWRWGEFTCLECRVTAARRDPYPQRKTKHGDDPVEHFGSTCSAACGWCGMCS